MMVLIMNGPWQEGVEGVSKKFGFVLSADPARNFRSFVKLRQGSGKERQGKARKGKYGER